MKICDLGRGMAEKERREEEKRERCLLNGAEAKICERGETRKSIFLGGCLYFGSYSRFSWQRGRRKKNLNAPHFYMGGKEFLVHLSDRANAAFKIPKNQEFETKISVQTEIAGKFWNIQQ